MALLQMPALRSGTACLLADSGAKNGYQTSPSRGLSGHQWTVEIATTGRLACTAELDRLPSFSGRVRPAVAIEKSRRWVKSPLRQFQQLHWKGSQASDLGGIKGRSGTLDFRIWSEEQSSETVTDWEPIATAAAASMAAQLLASQEEQEAGTGTSSTEHKDGDGALQHQKSEAKEKIRTSDRTTSKNGKANGAAAREHLIQDLINGHDHGVPLGRSAGRGGALKVAVDVDEVLCSFLATLNIYCAEAYAMHYDVSQYHVYDFRKIWNCSQEEANQKVHDFFQSRHFNSGIPPIPGAYEALQRLSSFCSLVIVTSRQHCIQEPSRRWIHAHYPELFEEIHFGNHFALEGVARSKSEICRSIDARVLIDDNPRYAVECAEAGIHVLLFDWNFAYPWSKTSDGPVHPLIQRVKDWTEVEAALQKLALHAVESG